MILTLLKQPPSAAHPIVGWMHNVLLLGSGIFVFWNLGKLKNGPQGVHPWCPESPHGLQWVDLVTSHHAGGEGKGSVRGWREPATCHLCLAAQSSHWPQPGDTR